MSESVVNEQPTATVSSPLQPLQQQQQPQQHKFSQQQHKFSQQQQQLGEEQEELEASNGSFTSASGDAAGSAGNTPGGVLGSLSSISGLSSETVVLLQMFERMMERTQAQASAQVMEMSRMMLSSQAVVPSTTRFSPSAVKQFCFTAEERSDEWLEQLEVAFELYRVPEGDRPRWAGLCMGGAASAWHVSQAKDMSWEAYRKAFIEYFRGPFDEEYARQGLVKLEQGSKSVGAFISAFRLQALRAGCTDPKMVKSIFLVQLSSSCRTEVSRMSDWQTAPLEEIMVRLNHNATVQRQLTTTTAHAKQVTASSSATSSSAAPFRADQLKVEKDMSAICSSRPLSNDDRRKLREAGGCFYCRQVTTPQHSAERCPQRAAKNDKSS